MCYVHISTVYLGGTIPFRQTCTLYTRFPLSGSGHLRAQPEAFQLERVGENSGRGLTVDRVHGGPVPLHVRANLRREVRLSPLRREVRWVRTDT